MIKAYLHGTNGVIVDTLPKEGDNIELDVFGKCKVVSLYHTDVTGNHITVEFLQEMTLQGPGVIKKFVGTKSTFRLTMQR